MNNARKLTKINLEFEVTWKYVKDHLADGNELSLTLLELVDFSNGHFFTLLPEEANLTNLYEFNLSEVLSQGPIQEFHVLGGNYSGVEKNTIKDEIADLLFKKIKDENLACLFEDVIRSPNYSYLEPLRVEKILRSLNKKVYYSVDESNVSINSLMTCVCYTDGFWHSVFILSKHQETNGYQEELSKEELVQLIQNLIHVFIGAYDSQGYIIWEHGHGE